MAMTQEKTEAARWRRPVRNLYLTLSLTLISLAAAGWVWGAMGYEMLIVALGWPHVLLGFVFFAGKVWRNAPQARAQALLLSAVTLIWWAAHYAFGLAAFIYIYFLYHAFRDEIFVYLTTRARHQGAPANVYARAGVVPLLLLLLVISQPQDYRQDLRRVTIRTTQTEANNWTLFSFRPVPDSRGHEFYFSLQAPHTAGAEGLTLSGRPGPVVDVGSGVRVNDQVWPDAASLLFVPRYAGQPVGPIAARPETGAVAIGLLGGHRVGQTFVAQADNLDGIALYTQRAETTPDAPLLLRVASPPLLPLGERWARLRWALIALAGAWLLWQVSRNWRVAREMWLYLALFGVTLIVLQNVLKSSSNSGYAVPMIFQLVVVFHYFSWYVFTFDKMHALAGAPRPVARSGFDGWLTYLREPRSFIAVVLGLSVLSLGGVAWYYLSNGPAVLRYGFDYSYFLYFLVFHVTFSFQPRLRHIAGQARQMA